MSQESGSKILAISQAVEDAQFGLADQTDPSLQTDQEGRDMMTDRGHKIARSLRAQWGRGMITSEQYVRAMLDVLELHREDG